MHFKQNNPDVCRKVDGLIEGEGIRVLILIAIRLVIAPFIETLIINDRLEFVRENNLRAHAIPLFDPSHSPRNIAVVFFK